MLLYKMAFKHISDLKRSILNNVDLDLDNLRLFKVIVSYFLKQPDVIRTELLKSFLEICYKD